MQLTSTIHVLTINFNVPLPSGTVTRSVSVTMLCHDRITLIDSGVKGSEVAIFGYLQQIGREPREIDTLILTHSHPDHIGAARAIVDATDCRIMAHEAERGWIEDVELQCLQRPVPGFHTLVGGSVTVDQCLAHGNMLAIGKGIFLTVLHTPGHSPGSISLWEPKQGMLISGDAVPVPGDMPVFEDFSASLESLERLTSCGADLLLSSWANPIHGSLVTATLANGTAWLRKIKDTVRSIVGANSPDPMQLCRDSVAMLGLPDHCFNPLVAKSFMSCLTKQKGDK